MFDNKFQGQTADNEPGDYVYARLVRSETWVGKFNRIYINCLQRLQ